MYYIIKNVWKFEQNNTGLVMLQKYFDSQRKWQMQEVQANSHNT